MAALVAVVLSIPALAQQVPSEAAVKLLPDRLGEFRAQGAAKPVTSSVLRPFTPEELGVSSAARRSYAAGESADFVVNLALMRSNEAAYALQNEMKRQLRANVLTTRLEIPNTLGFSLHGQVIFIKGAAFVSIEGNDPNTLGLARLLAETIEGRTEIPAVVQHLPDWERALEETTSYAVSSRMLREAVGDKPALDAVSFEGATEAAAATYGDARLVIVEFTTPQYAADNDARINERINELRNAGQPVPSLYNRVGNYSVFVFDAPDDGAAAELASQVKYEKEVRWLGDNPHAQARAEQQYANTMGNVILTTLKTTGLAILLCLSVGGLFGGAVFLYRRARATAAGEAYSDAGGMMRLNLEDVNRVGDTARLVGKREN